MPTQQPSKSDVWKNIAGLFLTNKKSLALVVFISLLSTGANLVEPLVYREAINDISGVFVQRAKDEASNQLTDTTSVASDSVDVADDTGVNEEEPSVLDVVTSRKEKHGKNSVAPRTPEQAITTLLWAVGLIFLVNILGHILAWVGENLNVKFACQIEQGFIQRTFAHVLKMPLPFFSKRSSAALSKQINQSEEVSSIVNGVSQQILPEIISLLGILTIMFWQNSTLTWLALIVIPFYLFIAWRSANQLETGLNEYYDRWEEVSTRMQDALGGIKTVKLSGAEDFEAAKFKTISSKAYFEYIKRSKLANKYVFWESALTKIASALVLGYGGYLTLENQLTPGDVVMFVAYLDRLYDPIDNLATLWVNMQQNVASISRAFKLLKGGDEEKRGVELKIEKGKIEFDNVHFGYNTNKEVLKSLSFTIQPGKVTAIVGGSGAGKTTAVDLLMKLYEPQLGKIFIDGQDLSLADPASVRSQIGMVAADGAIFRGTLADNIRYKKGEATNEEVQAAAEAAGLKVTLERLPDGLQTIVGESGFGLSVGERQRIQIARVLVAKPKVLILDEATANLDYATEAEVKKTVEEIRKENTVIVIAHRYSMVRDADQVIVLSQGKITEQGTPDELNKRDGWFTKFAKAAEVQ
jgi:ABC-type multidrug transport system fused ATPase/permease subunit